MSEYYREKIVREYPCSDQNTGEEIVRCRDCKWLDHHNLYLCMLPDGDGGYACWVVEPDGFCAWGARKEDA